MVETKRIKQALRKLQRLKAWQLIVLFILSLFISLSLLRLNNLNMIEHRQAVLAADKTGEKQEIKDSLVKLQRYISSHMNTDMGKGVYLEDSYKRDFQAVYNKASSQANPNGNIYKQVQDICMPRFSNWSQAYVQCTVDELAKYPASENLVSSTDLPKANVYLHSYISPFWSPDLAGWSVALSVVILIMIVSRFIGVVILKIIIKSRYKTI